MDRFDLDAVVARRRWVVIAIKRDRDLAKDRVDLRLLGVEWTVRETVERPWYRGGDTTRERWESLLVWTLQDWTRGFGSGAWSEGSAGLYVDEAGRLLRWSGPHVVIGGSPTVAAPAGLTEEQASHAIAAMARLVVEAGG